MAWQFLRHVLVLLKKTWCLLKSINYKIGKEIIWHQKPVLCGDQIAVLTGIIINSLCGCRVSYCFKVATIISVPKSNKIAAMTSEILKTFECLMLAYLKSISDPLLDFCSLHTEQITHARVLFVDSSSAFINIVLSVLHSKLTELTVWLFGHGYSIRPKTALSHLSCFYRTQVIVPLQTSP